MLRTDPRSLSMIKSLKNIIEKRIIKSSAEDSHARIFFFDSLFIMISVIYGLIVKIRILLYRKGFFKIRRLPCPVISIGNIVAGGSGKTPMAIYLAEVIKKMGLKPVVLSRGYRGVMEKHTGIVGDGRTVFLGSDMAGDEPYMMAKRYSFPVIIGKNRFKSGMAAIDAFNPDLIILDDGFQHIKLHRDLDILLLDCKNPLGNGRLLPAGRLRENPDELEKRADLIIFTRCPCTHKSQGIDFQSLNSQLMNSQTLNSDKKNSPCTKSQNENLHGTQSMKDKTGHSNTGAVFSSNRSFRDHEKINAMGKPCFNACHRPFLYCFKGHKNSAMVGEVKSLNCLRGKTAFLFSGIADNSGFKKTVEEAGIKVKGYLEFMDHHRYATKDIKLIAGQGKHSGADLIVTTEKDYARFSCDIDWDMDFAVIGINIGWATDWISDGNKESAEFVTWITKAVHRMINITGKAGAW